MLDDRKATILRAVVEEYIETGQPVGSGHVASRDEVLVSSATIRHDMGLLEQEGYLAQPHTSAGRVPTDKGYRFFVDRIVGAGSLGASEREEVQHFFARASGALEQMLADTSRLLSNLTDCAAVVVSPPHQDATIRAAQLVGLGGRTALVVVVLSDGSVEKALVDLPVDTGEERLGAATAHLARHLTGGTVSAPEAPPTTGDEVLDGVCLAALEALRTGHESETDAVFVGGASRMASAFDAVDTVRAVLTTLEQQYVVVNLLRDVLDRGLHVAIGAEHGLEPLATCSVVVAPFLVEGGTGTIGVLGPTRMHYPRAMAAVAYVGTHLGERLREG